MEHHPTQQVHIEIVAGSNDDIRIVKVSGPLSIHNFFEFQDLARKQPVSKILIVDLGEVPYIDSAALGSLVGIHVSCEKAGKKYALVNVNERLKALFRMTVVDQFLVVRNSVADAESYLSN